MASLRLASFTLFTLFVGLFSGQRLNAQGLHLAPEQMAGVHIESLQVQVHIVDGVASTELRQVFRNDGAQIAEATWILPLPQGASADGFRMTMGGKEVAGEVLDANKARKIYTDIVRRQRDPGLLEYMGRGCLKARVFPIPARGKMTVVVRYRQVLPEVAGLHAWSFPWRAARMGHRGVGKFSLDLQIQSHKAIKNAYSPNQQVQVILDDDHKASVSMEASGQQLPQRDLQVFYGLSDQEFGLNLLTYRRPGEAGYFMMMLAPKRQWQEQKPLPRLINFVLDTSGSMQGKKIIQAQGALRFFLASLKPQDHLNVIPFATQAQPFFSKPMAATKDNIQTALQKVKQLEARGGTNIEDALLTALKAKPQDGNQAMDITVFLTDGLPTVGTNNVDQLLTKIKAANLKGSRIFVFGVGHDVNTRLLDKVAADSHGDRDYVGEEEDIEVKTSALFQKLSHPVMTNISLHCDGVESFDSFPGHLPDMFRGSRLLVMGRYRGQGMHAIRLKGQVLQNQKEFVFEGSFPKSSTANDFLASLWAQKKVAALLDAIRLNGQNPELVQEIRKLGQEHGIVTPYTSHLILEDAQRLARYQYRGAADVVPSARDRANLRLDLQRAGALPEAATEGVLAEAGRRAEDEAREAEKSLDGMAASPSTGKEAVAKSMQIHMLGSVRGHATNKNQGIHLQAQRIQGHMFHLLQGIWVDSAYQPKLKDKVQKVKAFSPEYFTLLEKHPELATFFAFSTRLLVVLPGLCVEVTPAESKG